VMQWSIEERSTIFLGILVQYHRYQLPFEDVGDLEYLFLRVRRYLVLRFKLEVNHLGNAFGLILSTGTKR